MSTDIHINEHTYTNKHMHVIFEVFIYVGINKPLPGENQCKTARSDTSSNYNDSNIYFKLLR